MLKSIARSENSPVNINLVSSALSTCDITRPLFVNRILLQRIRAKQPHTGNTFEIIKNGQAT